ncbi:MAG: ACT domain-containing protein [Saccharofermentans sp.]|nr:ACT domain-containing protein [Saccharofermentans sp.]
MELQIIDKLLTVCKIRDVESADLSSDIYFIGKTDEEISLVCVTDSVPSETLEREDGWRAFRIKGTLDFSLVGILSKISKILADNDIGIFAVSTYNTDYILVKEENFKKALALLSDAGYSISQD